VIGQTIEAERAVLGACLISPNAVEDALPIITAADFFTIRHQTVFEAMANAWLAGERTDAVIVASTTGVDLAYLHELQNDGYSVSLVAHYARQVAEGRVRRRLVLAGSEIGQLGLSGGPALDALEQAQRLLADVTMPSIGEPDPAIDAFLASVTTDYDWVFPDFLERTDRLLFTSPEGAGKSTLLTQIAVMGASGLHPWTHREVDPVNCAIVDLENAPRLVARRLAKLRDVAGMALDPGRLRVATRPAGLDLTSAVDRHWLIERCIANRTELLCLGPAYRLAGSGHGELGGEDQARAVTEALDEVRARCGVTLVLETHAPHANGGPRALRPFGSSLWLRWPEFGVGLQPDPSGSRVTVGHWRGPRDERVWPGALVRGYRWPWTPEGMPDGTF
jgi:hypothetical protein